MPAIIILMITFSIDRFSNLDCFAQNDRFGVYSTDREVYAAEYFAMPRVSTFILYTIPVYTFTAVNDSNTQFVLDKDIEYNFTLSEDSIYGL